MTLSASNKISYCMMGPWTLQGKDKILCPVSVCRHEDKTVHKLKVFVALVTSVILPVVRLFVRPACNYVH